MELCYYPEEGFVELGPYMDPSNVVIQRVEQVLADHPWRVTDYFRAVDPHGRYFIYEFNDAKVSYDSYVKSVTALEQQRQGGH